MVNSALGEGKVSGISELKSVSSYLEPDSHVVNLEAITSHPLSIGDVGVTLTSHQKHFILRRLNLGGLLSLEDLPVTATFMIEKIEALPLNEAVEIIKEAIVLYKGDLNIPRLDYDLYLRMIANAPENINDTDAVFYESVKAKLIDASEEKKQTERTESDLEGIHDSYLIISDWHFQIRVEAALISYFSPYPEVRSISDPFDDPTIACETLRVYILGIFWTGLGTFINQFFSERLPGISLGGSTVQLLLYPSGMLLHKILPKKKLRVWKYEIDLNPGPWTYKEQTLATLFFSVSGGSSYVSSNIHVQKLAMFYNNKWVTFGYETLLILSTNFMGFGFAGVLRRFAVYPVQAMWPTLLPTLALNRAILKPESKENINGWTISRYNLFLVTTAGSFLYFWLPNYLFGALSFFNWMTWIAPNNFNLAMVTGSISGLGLNPIPTFDLNVIGVQGALSTPFYTQINGYIGGLIGLVVILGIYYSNFYWTAYLPINSASLFTNTGEYYRVTKVVDSNSVFDEAKYQKVGPPFYTAANLVTYGTFFALYPLAFIYEIATNCNSFWLNTKSLFSSLRNPGKSHFSDFTDPHSIMMSRYKEVPDWAFLVILVLSIMLAILCVELFPTETPVWGIFFALGINFVFLIPIANIGSRTGFTFGLNVLVELIVGYALPGNGLALIFIKALGYNIDGQADNYITDQKMAHYAKVPPRALFRVQMLSIFMASFIGLAVMNFEIDTIKDYCMPHQKDKFTCPGSTVFYSSSVIWGVIGPKKVFDGLYPILKYCFLIGAVAGVLFAVIRIYGPEKYRYFHPVLLVGGILGYAPSNLSYSTGGLYVSIASMWYLKKYYRTFWIKYNYVFGSAVSAGTALSGIIIFFAVQYKSKNISWWGNNVSYSGIDGGNGQQSLYDAATQASDGYFGPRIGHFP